MYWLNRCLVAVLLAGAFACPLRAQDPDSTDVRQRSADAAVDGMDPDWITVDLSTNLPEALVYADSTLIGVAAARRFEIPAGAARLRLVAPNLDSWTIPPIATTIEAEPGDTLEVGLDFPYHYRIESMPFGATVHLESAEGWEKLGQTPFSHTSVEPLDGVIVIERPGYSLERLDVGSNVWNRHSVMLNPAEERGPEAAEVDWKPPRRHRNWIDYAAIGTAVAAGALAVHYKFKADNLFDDHRTTADDEMRERIEALDTRSGVAFGVMQAGIGLFAIRLVFR